MRKEYTLGDLTVVWQPDLCVHCGNCYKSLPEVFKPRERPWIQLNEKDRAATIRTVRACPPGAISLKNPDIRE